uniref:IF rod domain-containing protein n=1 Tax=Neolamprologus brichardi TaxID=32507 RepID=A0A3Q4MK86_NEOBR
MSKHFGEGTMSYSSEIYSSSYRKIFGDAPRSGRVGLGSSSPSRLHSAGYRSSHRTYGSPSAISSSTTYRRTAAPGRVFSSMPDHAVDLTQSTAVTNELKIIRTNEKEQLQGLNDRFVSFIEKVHNLEQQNKILEPSPLYNTTIHSLSHSYTGEELIIKAIGHIRLMLANMCMCLFVHTGYHSAAGSCPA